MLIPIIKGTTEIIEKVKDGETILRGCPECQHNLLLKQFREWGTVFFIPLAPRKDTRLVYECISCFETFDIAYRNTFINKGKYLNATPKEIWDLTNDLSLTILAAILTSDNRPTENVVTILKDFATSSKIDTITHEEKFSSYYLSQENLAKSVFDSYDIFRDSFADEFRNEALHEALKYCSIIDLSAKETKVLYTFSRHWGITKEQFELLHKAF
jgi:hypothetical protein